MYNSDETPKSDGFITLKVSSRPVKHYKIIRFEEEQLWDYKGVINKIKLASKKDGNYFVLYLKRNLMDEIVIYNQTDWSDYYFNNIIQNFIDGRRILKIEFEVTRNPISRKNFNNDNHNEEKLRVILKNNSNQWFLNSLIGFIEKNKTVQEELKKHFVKEIFLTNNTEISNSASMKTVKSLTNSNVNIKTELMNSIVIDKFNSIKKKIEACQEIENSINESDSLVEDEIKTELSVSGSNDKINHDILGDIPSFSSYYNEKVRMTYHEKFIRETAMDFEQN